MSSCAKAYTIKEYGSFSRGKAVEGYKKLPPETFDALEMFILASNSGATTDAIELMSLSARRGIGKVITARNYVGVITMNDGTVIEILPKIANEEDDDDKTRKIFLEMLKTLKDVRFKDFSISGLKTERLDLFEIFIRMFLDEIAVLTKQGLKAAYTPVESNERFYKGKLLVTQNLKYNLVRKERFFVRCDEFNMNRPENRLIKSTLAFLLKMTRDARNRRNTTQLLTFFDGVDYSANYETDISQCNIDHGMSHYGKALSWCQIFLRGNSFAPFAGREVAIALLFPMEEIFESFVAAKFRRLIGDVFTMRTQDHRYSLFDRPSAFALCPDIVLENDERTIVLDTKWKLLAKSATNHGISQSDMYQMYAYGKKYRAKKVVLLYPLQDIDVGTYHSDKNNHEVVVEVAFIDLIKPDDSMGQLIAKL